MAEGPFAQWSIDPSDYPEHGESAAKLRFLLRYAILAPSGHNTQPWRFRIEDDRVDLFADRERRLPVVDPHARELVISCGAALVLLRTAMRRFGHAGAIDLLPDPDAPDLLARVALGPAWNPTPVDKNLFQAITRRRTNRLLFEQGAIPGDLIDELRKVAQDFDVELTILTDDHSKSAVAGLIAEGDRAQFADPLFRRELGSWLRSRHGASRDGISGSSYGLPDRLSSVEGLAIRAVDIGGVLAGKDRETADTASALVIVSTVGDTPHDWLATGMAHGLMLLTVTAAGLATAYANQPVEVEGLRDRLRQTLQTSGHPQILLRIGRAPAVQPAVRRPLEEVLLDSTEALSETAGGQQTWA